MYIMKMKCNSIIFLICDKFKPLPSSLPYLDEKIFHFYKGFENVLGHNESFVKSITNSTIYCNFWFILHADNKSHVNFLNVCQYLTYVIV